MASQKIPKTVVHKARRFVNKIAKLRAVDEAYIFGSYVQGKQRVGSDIDVAVISESFEDSYDSLVFLNQQATTDELLRIEAHGFTPDDLQDPDYTLAQIVKNTGVKIYQADK